MSRKLQIGSGTEILDGYVNTDLSPLKGIDVSCTIDAGGLPFADDTFAEVLAINILEPWIWWMPCAKFIEFWSRAAAWLPR